MFARVCSASAVIEPELSMVTTMSTALGCSELSPLTERHEPASAAGASSGSASREVVASTEASSTSRGTHVPSTQICAGSSQGSSTLQRVGVGFEPQSHAPSKSAPRSQREVAIQAG